MILSMLMFQVADTAASVSQVTFSFREVMEILVLAFAMGGLFTQVRTNSKKIEALDVRHTRLEERFLQAIEDLGDDLVTFGSEIRSVLAIHETRITVMEKVEK